MASDSLPKPETPAGQKPAKASRDWITISTGIGALAVAILVAYLANRTNDDVSVRFTSQPRIEVDLAATVLLVWPTHQITFINAGNRFASVRPTSFQIFQPSDPDQRFIHIDNASCNPDKLRRQTIYYTETQFPLKPGQIETVELTLATRDKTIAKEPMMVALPRPLPTTGGLFKVSTCMGFVVTTPDKTMSEVIIPLQTMGFPGQFATVFDFRQTAQPISLLEPYRRKVGELYETTGVWYVPPIPIMR